MANGQTLGNISVSPKSLKNKLARNPTKLNTASAKPSAHIENCLKQPQFINKLIEPPRKLFWTIHLPKQNPRANFHLLFLKAC